MSNMLDKMRAAFKQPEKNGSGGNFEKYYPFFNMKNGEKAIIRFVPDKNEDNPLGFLVEKTTHTLEINGEKKNVPCMNMYGEECPICKVSAQYYKAGDKINGKKYWKKKAHLAQAIVVDDPLPKGEDGTNSEGKLKYIALSYQLFTIIQEAFQSDELEEIPCAVEGGYDFIIKKSEQGEYSTYAVGTKFANKQRDLDDEDIALIEADSIDLSTLLPANPGKAKIEAMLEAALTGGSVQDDDEEFETPAPKKSSKPSYDDEDAPAPKKQTKAAPPPAEDDEFEAEADEILARIRNRKKSAE